MGVELEKGEHIRFMRMALLLARKGAGHTSPNPMVGAVIVRGGRIVGKGYHRSYGAPHAEVEAIAEAADSARGATLYVNLEPCNHWGKTPPCTQAIIQAGIQTVVFGIRDPNPAVPSGGADFLRSRGLVVIEGVLEERCRSLNEAFIKFITTGRPFVIMKVASSLDGKIATSIGESRWITGERSRSLVHRLRASMDAVMVGIGTVLKDDPELTCRLPGKTRRTPARIVVDPRLRMPLEARMLSLSCGKTLIAASFDADARRARALEERGAEVIMVNGSGGRLDLSRLMDILGQRKITSVLVEGGASLFGSALEQGIVDKAIFFYSPKIIGGQDALSMIGGKGAQNLKDAWLLERLSVRRIGTDIMIEAYPAKRADS